MPDQFLPNEFFFQTSQIKFFNLLISVVFFLSATHTNDFLTVLLSFTTQLQFDNFPSPTVIWPLRVFLQRLNRHPFKKVLAYVRRTLQIQHHLHYLVSPIPIQSISSLPPVLPMTLFSLVTAARAPERVQLPLLPDSISTRASKRASMTGLHVSNPYNVVFNGVPVPDAPVVSDMSYHFASNATDPHFMSQPITTVHDSRKVAGEFSIPVPDSSSLTTRNDNHSIGLHYSASGPLFHIHLSRSHNYIYQVVRQWNVFSIYSTTYITWGNNVLRIGYNLG